MCVSLIILVFAVLHVSLSCPALEPHALSKTASADRYKSGKAPLLFYHVQKAGGTSFCEMYVQVLAKRNVTVDRGDNCNGPWRELVANPTMAPKSPGQIISVEPAYEFMGKWRGVWTGPLFPPSS